MATLEHAVTEGVSFALTDEQRALRELAHEFAEKEIRPKAADYDEHQTHPADVIAKAHEVGLMNLHVPAEYGGPELGLLDGALVSEELNWGCSGMGTAIAVNGLGAGPVIIAGTEEQKRTWLAPLAEAPILCSFGLTEPDAGSDVARIKSTAVRKGGEYVLNGSKTFITNAGHAAWTVIFAKTDPAEGHRGISAFVVPMDTPGVTIEKHLDKMGQRSTDTSAFALTDVVVPAANRLGEEGDGFKIAMQTLDGTRPGTAIGAVGVARAAFEYASDYAKGRVTPQGHALLLDGEAVRRRHGDGGDHRCRPDLRRLRLHQGVPGREADAGRQALPDLRGHLADPAAGDRPRRPAPTGLGAPSSNTCRLLARYHAARCPAPPAAKPPPALLGRLRRAYAGCVLSRPNSFGYWGSLRPCIAWC